MYNKHQVINKGRNSGDSIADQVVKSWSNNPKRSLFLNQIQDNNELQIGIKGDIEFNALIESVFSKDLNPQAIQAATLFFRSNQQLIMALLGLYSLPYCYAAANGAKVLIHSKNILENPEKRLFETARFVLDVCSEEAFDSSGIGFISIFKVRLLHAYIRYHASRFILDETPINQMDMAGTNLAFSLIVLRGLEKMGVEVSIEEKSSWIQYWNFIGSGLGIERDFLPNDLNEASWLDRVIRNDQFKSNESGKLLTASLLKYFDSLPINFLIAKPSNLVSALLGNEISEYLGLNYSEFGNGFLLNAMRVRSLMVELGIQFNTTDYDVSPILIPNHGQFFQIPN